MATIYLDAWAMKGEPTGVSRYCRELIPRLVAAAPEHRFIVLRPSRRTDPRPVAAVREVVVQHVRSEGLARLREQRRSQ